MLDVLSGLCGLYSEPNSSTKRVAYFLLDPTFVSYSSPTLSPPLPCLLSKVNEYNRELARTDGREFIDEDDLSGLHLRSGNVYERNRLPQPKLHFYNP